MPYGTIKIDTITFTDGGVDKSVPVSGLVLNPTFTGNVTVTGTISGNIIQGGTTVSGLTVTGTTANFASGVFTTQVSGLLITGPTVSATTGTFTSLTGTTTNGTTASFTTGNFTSLTGTTTTGTTANFASGVFTTQVSGLLITGPTVSATTGTFTSLTGTTTTGTTANFASGVFTTQISGVTITGTTVSTTTGNFTSLTGTTATITSGIIASGTAALPSLAILSDPNTGIYSPGADQLAVATNGTGRLFIDASGNVGVGTSAPDVLLHSRITGGGGVPATSGTSQPNAVIRIGGSSTAGVLDIGCNSDAPWIQSTDRTDLSQKYKLLLNPNGGNVGIGTSSPASVLDVAHSNSGITLTNTGASNKQWRLGGNSAGSFVITETGVADRLIIDSSGRVGINTTSPTQALSVVGNILADGSAASQYIASSKAGVTSTYVMTDANGGNIQTDGAWPIRFTINSSERARITSAGLVGIGTSSPANRITAAGAEASVGIFNTTAGSTASPSFCKLNFYGYLEESIWNVASISAGNSATNTYGGTLRFATNTEAGTHTTALTIDNQQRVGIGTTSPLTKLDVRTGVITAGSASSSVGTEILRGYYSDTEGALAVIGTERSSGGTVIGSAVKPSNLATDAFFSSTSVAIPRGAYTIAGNIHKWYIGATQTVAEDSSVSMSEAMRIDSSGRLLVGTSSARSNFYNSTNSPQLQIEGNDNSKAALAIIQDFNANTQGGQLVLAKNNSTTIGTNVLVVNDDILGAVSFQGNDGTEFVEGASITAAVDGTSGANDLPARLVFSTTADGAASPTERMRITSTGQIFVNSTSALSGAPFINVVFSASTNTAFCSNDTSGGSGAQHFRFFSAGTQVGNINTTTTATAYATSSDYRLKENVVQIPNAITRLQQLKPSRFNFIADPDTVVDGFIAHEVQDVVTEAITGDKDAVDDDGNPVYQGIDQSKLVPLLTAALQEAIAKIEILEQRLTAAGID